MAKARRLSSPAPTPQSFLECLRYFLTPTVWRQAHQALRRSGTSRWQPQPLLFVLLVMTWCLGDSLSERFETARAFYVACYQRRRRPGETYPGWQKALTRTPASALRAVAAALRSRLAQVFAKYWLVDGFVPLGCDGTGLACPHTRELEHWLRHRWTARRQKRRRRGAPQIGVTALVHLGLGLLWSWRLGVGAVDERQHLHELLPTLPPRSLVVADAGYVGYELLTALENSKVSFLIRLSSKAPLYSLERVAFTRFREGRMYYWPLREQKKRPPLTVRILQVGRRGKPEVWLMTNVLDADQLPHASASRFYRWRWRNEGLFRTYKRTLGKVKLMSRTLKSVHRETEGSLLAVQILLAHGALAVPSTANTARELPSARTVLLEIRAEIRQAIGMYLGPRQARSYFQRLRQARRDRRRQRRNQVRRRWASRRDHQPPKRPTIRKMGTMRKERAEKMLRRKLTR